MTTQKDTYLQDPDEQMDSLGRISSEPIQAKSLEQAEAECEELAKEYGVTLESTTKRDRAWYDCNFRG
ncbi:hypothetical protein [Coleofasciculus sp. F4-SAH-05]|uniref:hypothetical protein n=1 Tax=Coleofasciculus sp. F4-SAH-05 TaxID=3069525 RepID=UPI0032F7B6BF